MVRAFVPGLLLAALTGLSGCFIPPKCDECQPPEPPEAFRGILISCGSDSDTNRGGGQTGTGSSGDTSTGDTSTGGSGTGSGPTSSSGSGTSPVGS